MGNYFSRVYDLFRSDNISRKRKIVQQPDACDEEFLEPEIKRLETLNLIFETLSLIIFFVLDFVLPLTA